MSHSRQAIRRCSSHAVCARGLPFSACALLRWMLVHKLKTPVLAYQPLLCRHFTVSPIATARGIRSALYLPGASASSMAPDPSLGSDVTRQNFKEQLPRIKAALETCSFYAVDLEMTGLQLDHHRDEYFDEPQDRYSRLRESAAAYVITQFGLSCFKQVEGGYEATTFNAYIFPEPLSSEVLGNVQSRRFLSDAGSLSFLANQHFDFNRWVREGVPYLPLRTHQELVQQAARAERRDQAPRNEVIIDKPEDQAMVQQLVEQVCEWLSSSDEQELTLPRASGYQRLLAYQELARPRDWAAGGGPLPEVDPEDAPDPGFYVTKVEVDGWSYIRLVKGNRAQAAEAEAARRARMTALLAEAAGFSQVMQAMRDCHKPAVFHNGGFDLVYILASFAHGLFLPPLWQDFKQLVAAWFPAGIYDTKYLAQCIADRPAITPEGTALGDLFRALTQDGAPRTAAAQLLGRASANSTTQDNSTAAAVALPTVRHAPGSLKYEGLAAGEAAHEAGYDAYMTGSCFSILIQLVAATERLAMPPPSAMAVDSDNDPMHSVAHLAGRFNMSRSDLAYLAMQGPELPLQRQHVLHLSGGPPTARFPDVLAALTAAGLPGRPRLTPTPPGTNGGLGGYLLEMELPACTDWTAARLSRALEAAAAQDTLGAATPVSSTTAWVVQSYADYAVSKQRPLREGVEAGRRGVNEGGGLAGVKRRRGEEEAATTAGASGPATAAVQQSDVQHNQRNCTVT